MCRSRRKPGEVALTVVLNQCRLWNELLGAQIRIQIPGLSLPSQTHGSTLSSEMCICKGTSKNFSSLWEAEGAGPTSPRNLHVVCHYFLFL